MQRTVRSRSLLAAAALGLVATLGVGGGCASSDDPRGSRPDVVLVVIDTLRADHLGVYGHERDTSPTIDRLAREGVWFRRAFSHSGWTLASFASLLTGLLPHEHRVGRNPLPKTPEELEFGRLADGVTTLAEHFSEYGYASKAIVNNTFLAPEFRLDQGFDEYDYRPAENTNIRSAEASVEIALEWMRSTDEPQLLMLHFMEPHLVYGSEHLRGHFTGPGEPPVEVPFGSKDVVKPLMRGEKQLTGAELDYVKRLYDEEILTVDRALEPLIDFIERRTGRPTVVVITADHGEEFFDHGRFEHGHTLFSELTRVPLVLWGAGIEGGEQSTLVQHADLFHGLLSLAGAGAETHGTAVDLFDVLERPQDFTSRQVVAENCLYDTQKAAIIDGEHSLHFDMTRRQTRVFELDASGVEAVPLPKERAEPIMERLGPELRRLRGDSLKPVDVSNAMVPSQITLEGLHKLGYTARDD